jgi:hypothetical protein
LSGFGRPRSAPIESLVPDTAPVAERNRAVLLFTVLRIGTPGEKASREALLVNS